MIEMEGLGARAREAEDALACAGTLLKNQALEAIAKALEEHQEQILEANALDLEQADQRGISPAMRDRLMLTASRIQAMADGVRQVARLEDPVGQVLSGGVRPNGLKIEKVRVPLGVIGMIYEARPNVTVDSAALCLKSGNAVILRSGREAFHSSLCLSRLMRSAAAGAGLPEDAVQFVEDPSREAAQALMACRCLDVLIPRGGAGLIRSCVENASVPVLETGTGNCHIYVDESADMEMAASIVENSKTSRPSVCNAAESLLVHQSIASAFLPLLKRRLDGSAHPVEFRGCPRARKILDGIRAASEEDYACEFLDYILSVRVVDSLEEAIQHIRKYSTGHSECIVTNSLSSAGEFQKRVDAAAVYVNASTRFTDGSEFGFGAEIGISTQKLHARGPMGLTELTTTKYLVSGNGQIR